MTAAVKENLLESLVAEHNGYRKIASPHRKVAIQADGHWEIVDQIQGAQTHPHSMRLHWLSRLGI
jgi:hypothetical protein